MKNYPDDVSESTPDAPWNKEGGEGEKMEDWVSTRDFLQDAIYYNAELQVSIEDAADRHPLPEKRVKLQEIQELLKKVDESLQRMWDETSEYL